MELMSGVENRVRERGVRYIEEDGEEIEKEEVERVIRKLKLGKVVREDGISNEVWKYGGKELKEEVWSICNRVWREEGWPEGWRVGLIVPILKKGEGNKVADFRGVTLMNTISKIYAAILEKRLGKEIEDGRMIGENQTGFRRRMGVMEKIFTLNYIINRELGKKGGRLVGCFIDIKAAFDTVDRRKLWEVMEKRGV